MSHRGNAAIQESLSASERQNEISKLFRERVRRHTPLVTYVACYQPSNHVRSKTKNQSPKDHVHEQLEIIMLITLAKPQAGACNLQPHTLHDLAPGTLLTA